MNMQVFPAYIGRNARRFPDRTALIFEGCHYSYGTLYGHSVAVADALSKRGTVPQDRVAVLAMNRPEWIELGWACGIASFILTTINYRLAAAEMLYIVNDSAPRVLVFEAQYADLVDSIRSQFSSVEILICLGEGGPAWATSYADVLGEGQPSQAISLPNPADFSTLIYTSGTTGRPKGVVKSQAAMLAMFQANAFNLGMRPHHRILITMPLYHVGAMGETHAMLYTGGTVVLHRSFDPAEALRTIEREKITHVHLAPTMIQALMNEGILGSVDVSSLEVFNYAAAPMPVSLLQEAINRFGLIFVDIYGSTEVSGTILHANQHVLDGNAEDTKRLGSVGQSTPGTELRVVDDEDNDCPSGVPGEIVVRSATMMSQYWNNSVATIEALRGGWVHTGDVGYLDDQEYLYLVDRKKDMIISGGENIYCREVEEALMQHEGVEDVAVIGVPHDYWGEAVHAVVIRKADSSLSEDELIAFSREVIARYKCPKSVEFVEELPRLPSGKVTKPVLRENHLRRLGRGADA
jgi:acyl-CoA synthetase (AMP-forming)/AMP-acid ligase II